MTIHFLRHKTKRTNVELLFT
ncbi:hypothetical protein Rin_00008870, partial [Candidatus Regiella insecticola 5.15]